MGTQNLSYSTIQGQNHTSIWGPEFELHIYFIKPGMALEKEWRKKTKKKTWMIGYSWYAWNVRVKDGLTAVVLACVGSSSLAALLLFKKLTDILRCHHLNKEEEERINTRPYKLIFISTIYISSSIAYLSFCSKSLQIVLQFCLHVIIFWKKIKCERHNWIDSKRWVVKLIHDVRFKVLLSHR